MSFIGYYAPESAATSFFRTDGTASFTVFDADEFICLRVRRRWHGRAMGMASTATSSDESAKQLTAKQVAACSQTAADVVAV